MGNFISNLIARHSTAANYVLPRLRGRFESQGRSSTEARQGYLPTDTGMVHPLAADPHGPTGDPFAGTGQMADHTFAGNLSQDGDIAAQELPQPGNRYEPYDPAAPAKGTVTPPGASSGRIASLFRPPLAAHHGNGYLNRQPPLLSGASFNSPGLPATSGDSTEDFRADARQGAVDSTVNRSGLNNRPAEKNGVPATPAGQEQRYASGSFAEQERRNAAGALYYTVQPSARQQAAFSFDKQPPPLTFTEGFAHLSPDRNSYRSVQPAAAAVTQQVIKVTIGRIDVRATPQPASAKAGAAARPAMSLDDYLKKRSGGTS